MWGAGGSIIMLILLLIFASYSYSDVGNKIVSLQDHSEWKGEESKDFREGIKLDEVGFHMGFGIRGGLDPRIGTMGAYNIIQRRDEQDRILGLTSRPIVLTDCKDLIKTLMKKSKNPHKD